MSPLTEPIPPSIAVVVRKEDLATTTTTSIHIVLDQLTAEFGQGFGDEVLDDFFFRLLDDNDLLHFFEGVNNKVSPTASAQISNVHFHRPDSIARPKS
jgi:hypothetical protein